jgi:hypothetical protein
VDLVIAVLGHIGQKKIDYALLKSELSVLYGRIPLENFGKTKLLASEEYLVS